MEKRSIQIAATMSLRPKGFKRTTYAEKRTQDGDQAFLERSTDIVASGRLVDVTAHCLLDKFEKFQHSVNLKNLTLAEEDARLEAEYRKEFRDSFLHREREKKMATTLKTQELTKNWRSTQMVKRDRIKRDLQFEMVTEEIGTLKHTYKQQIAKKAEVTGIENFEKNMKKMGISTGDGENVRLSISYEAGDIYEKRLKETVAAKLPSNEEIQSFVNQLKDRTAEKRQARYEKARRRRRALTNASAEAAGDSEHSS